MARGRMINRCVATSQKVAELEDKAGPWALVFQHRIIAFLDINGNCRADPYWLKAEIMPRVSGCSPEDCRKFAGAMVDVGLAVIYEVDGMPYLHFPGFRDEQVGLRVDREAPEVPVPQGFDEPSGKLPETFRQASGNLPLARAENNEVEGEVEGEVSSPNGDSPKSDEPLSELWTVWLEELGGNPPHPRWTDKRRQKIRAFYREHLADESDPMEQFRHVLKTVKQSDHHMSTRSYQMPESLFRSPERRDRWATLAKGNTGPNGHHWADDL